MKRLKYLASALALVACAPMAMAQAADKSDAMWKNFYGKLASIVRGGNQNAKMMVCLNVPGIPLRPLKSTMPADVNYVNELLDQTAAYNPAFTPGKFSFSKVYGDILRLHVSDKPIPLEREEQAEFDKAIELTKPKGNAIKKYNQYREAERWENLEKGKGLTNKKSLDSAVNDAMDNWLGDGQKNIIDAARSNIVKYSNNDPGSWWKTLANNYSNSIQGNFHNVSTFPPMDQWASDDGWLKFTYKASDKKSSEKFNKMDAEAAASLNVGKFSGSASGGYKNSSLNAMSSDDSLEITMEVKKVIVNRPEVDWSVFTNEKWQWSNGVVSDEKGGGMLPLYTDAFVIVRKVKFKAKSIEKAKAEMMKEINANVKASFGPFSMSASFNKKDEEKASSEKEDKGAISIPDPQIIAFACSIVPRCPAKTVK
jgi:hypothetical protein